MTNTQLRQSLILMRKNSGLSRVKFCAILHPWLNPHTLKRWESGQSRVNLLAAEKLGLTTEESK